MADDPVFSLSTNPVHLGLGATVVREPAFTGDVSWYAGYGERHGDDGVEGRLVSLHTFTAPWDVWEVHPLGEELVVCTAGQMTVHQKDGPDGEVRTVVLRAGDAVINPVGWWHTADVEGTATALFVTAGEGTENIPR